MDIADDPLVETGTRRVRILVRAKEDWDRLSGDRAERGKDFIIERMRKRLDGERLPKTQFKKIRVSNNQSVWEFKGDQVRAWCVELEDGYVVVHVGIKKRDKISKEDMRKIVQRIKELPEQFA